MNFTMPEKPILVFASLANTLGLEEATMLSLLDELTRHRQSKYSSGYHWHELNADTLAIVQGFWNDHDIQRISQRLRDLGVILLSSAPYVQCHQLAFAFNQPPSAPSTPLQETVPKRQLSPGTTLMPANWQPGDDVLASLSQHNIPEHFAREQLPEFVNYWRESGETQRSWGTKFIYYVKRNWTYHTTRLAKNAMARVLATDWQPSSALFEQIKHEDIPATFTQKSFDRFRLYHQSSGTTHTDWDMPFFSWLKEDWNKQETPFIDKKKSTFMSVDWQPSEHTLNYLQSSYGIDVDFIRESVPEFTHKWIEKNAMHSEWGTLFAKHVIEQWRFVQAGVNSNPEPQLITQNWQPSADCVQILVIQSGVDRDFIRSQIPEFILYWTNRSQPMHSWDNVFLRHIKHQWAQHHEGQQRNFESTRTKDRSVAEQLVDRSWAS
jgi:hypothetical protein